MGAGLPLFAFDGGIDRYVLTYMYLPLGLAPGGGCFYLVVLEIACCYFGDGDADLSEPERGGFTVGHVPSP